MVDRHGSADAQWRADEDLASAQHDEWDPHDRLHVDTPVHDGSRRDLISIHQIIEVAARDAPAKWKVGLPLQGLEVLDQACLLTALGSRHSQSAGARLGSAVHRLHCGHVPESQPVCPGAQRVVARSHYTPGDDRQKHRFGQIVRMVDPPPVPPTRPRYVEPPSGRTTWPYQVGPPSSTRTCSPITKGKTISSKENSTESYAECAVAQAVRVDGAWVDRGAASLLGFASTVLGMTGYGTAARLLESRAV